MNVSSLTASELGDRLAGHGLFLRTGPFVARIQSSIPSVASGIRLMYADSRLAGENGFADFHVRLATPANIRRWFRPQVLFFHDGMTPFKPLPLDQAYPMLEWGLNWCISSFAHQYLIIHAAVIEYQGRAAILPAPPGSGKSTLCAALVQRGWRLLSDELALIRLSDGYFIPLSRPVSLKNASIQIIRDFEPSAVVGPLSHDTSKGTVAHLKPPAESIRRIDEHALPGWIVFPRYEAGADPKLSAETKAQSFMRVAESAFNYSFLGGAGFHAMSRLIDTCDSFDFVYSRLDDAIAAFENLARTK